MEAIDDDVVQQRKRVVDALLCSVRTKHRRVATMNRRGKDGREGSWDKGP